MTAKRSKYGATRTVVDGITFASKAEARRYGELKLLERAGEISGVALQHRLPVSINGTFVFTYIADFSYWDKATNEIVFEDVKGMDTPLSKLKRKCVAAEYGKEVVIVKMRAA